MHGILHPPTCHPPQAHGQSTAGMAKDHLDTLLLTRRSEPQQSLQKPANPPRKPPQRLYRSAPWLLPRSGGCCHAGRRLSRSAARKGSGSTFDSSIFGYSSNLGLKHHHDLQQRGCLQPLAEQSAVRSRSAAKDSCCRICSCELSQTPRTAGGGSEQDKLRMAPCISRAAAGVLALLHALAARPPSPPIFESVS